MSKEKNYFSEGKVYVISSSHNDLAWLDVPIATILFRNKHIIAAGIEMIEQDPLFVHNMESCLYLQDFLALNPEMQERMQKLIEEKRFGWGAMYTQTFETTLTGEGLVRQYYLGKRWIEKHFPGADIRTTWNQDVPGRTMQSAQVMRKCGVDYLAVSRMNEGFYRWYSPDGSYVSGHSVGHYHENSISQIISLSYTAYSENQGEADYLQENFANAEEIIYQDLCDIAEKYHKEYKLPPLHCYVAIRDYDFPLNINKLLKRLNNNEKYSFPHFVHSRVEEFMDDAVQKLGDAAQWKTYKGERPNEWVYQMPGHAETYRENRHGLFLLDEVELFSTINLYKNKLAYPKEQIDQAWKNLLYLDHGFGGRGGHITDETYRQVSIQGREIAESLRSEALEKLDEQIECWQDGHYVTLYNPLQWEREDVAELCVDWKLLGSVSFALQDREGNSVPFQIIGEPAPYTFQILMFAKVPALGYKRFSLVPLAAEDIAEDRPAARVELHSSYHASIENDYYKIALEEGGFSSLFDKEMRKELLDLDVTKNSLRAFEIYMLHSVGNGAGEFHVVQHAEFELEFHGLMRDRYGQFTGATRRSSNYGMRWQICSDGGLLQHNGSLLTILTGQARFPHFTLRQELRIYHCIKRIDTKVDIISWDGTMYEELRLGLPLQSDFPNIHYEVPMGILRVGQDEVSGALGKEYYTERNANKTYPTECKDIHPREMQSWVGSMGADGGVLLSCCDTPAFDFANLHNSTVIQPILLASRHSCNSMGNPYAQAGSHSFAFSLLSGSAGLDLSPRMEFVKHKLIPRVLYAQAASAAMPAAHSWIHVEGDVRLSAVKCCEDSDELVIRVYEPYGNTAAFKLRFDFPIEQVRNSDMLEYGGSYVETELLESLLPPYAIETFCLKLAQS